MHNHVRAQELPVPFYGQLFGEIDVVDHPRYFDDASELEFSPAPPYMGGSQGGDELGGLGPQVIGGAGHRFHLLGESAVGFGAGAFCCRHLFLHIGERFRERIDEGFDRVLPLLEFGCACLLGALEPLFGVGEKGPRVTFERFGG